MDDFEDVPLTITTAAYERTKRRNYKRNILISVLLATTVVVVIILFSTLSSTSTPNDNAVELEILNTSLKLGAPGPGQDGDVPVVQTLQGQVQGSTMLSRKGRHFYSFFSIPYGAPPVRELRFEPPQPAGKWSGVRDSTFVRTQCLSYTKASDELQGDEDCLHLHIVTPELPRRRRRSPKLPVVVFIYGGGFAGGRSSRYGTHYYMDEDVIFVYVNYRLGAFGHLNTGDSIVKGNLSLKDQILALKWVRDNIEAFGGDAKSITLIGNSSGAMSVHAHMLSEQSKGLFHRAISQSGVALGSNTWWQDLHNPGINAKLLGQELGCPNPTNTTELVRCLKNADAGEIARANNPGILWRPSMESPPENGDTSQMFWKDLPINLMRQGDFAKVPWIVGINNAEEFRTALDFLQDQESINSLNQNWSSRLLETELQLNASEALDKKIRDFYFNGSETVDRDERYGLEQLLSDRQYVHPTRIAAMLHSKHSDVYLYYMSKESNYTLKEEKKHDFPPPYGAGHGDELQYFFNSTGVFPAINESNSLYTFSEDLVKMWVSFAKTGKPKARNGDRWRKMKEADDGLNFYELTDYKAHAEPLNERMKFWDSIMDEYAIYE